MALTGNTMNGTAVGYRCRVSKKWYYTDGTWCAFTKTPGVTPSISSPQMSSSDTSATGNQYTVCIQYTTPNDASISSIQSITCNFKIYDRNSTKGTLYASLRTVAPSSTNSDTWAEMRNNAIGSEVSITDITTTAAQKSATFTSSSLAKNTTYYLYLYTKSTNDIYTIQTGSSHSSSFSCSVNYTKVSYTVSYDANGGSGAPSSQTKIYGESLTLSSTKPTKSNGSNTATSNFDITGNANGGYFGTTSTTTTKITATATTPQTIKYTFSSWNTAKAGTGTSYNAGASYTANSAATLYAQYTSTTTNGTTTYSNNAISGLTKPSRANTTEATYTITLVANGGSVSNSSLTSKKTRSYTFKGWAESSTATSVLANTKTYTSAKTVYAIWDYTDATAAVALPTPTRNGYTFKGWATSTTATTGITGDYTPTANITFYAIWALDGSVIFYNDNGTSVGCVVYYNDNGTPVLCSVFYNNNGSAVLI